MRLHERARAVIDAYLDAVGHEVPGLVEGLYLSGSIALGDFRPNTSDIDFVAVTSERPDPSAIAALHRAHMRLRKQCPRPFFDGRYVTWRDLATDPSQIECGPCSYEGRFRSRGCGDCDPVTWHTLACHGVRCLGPELSTIDIWRDTAALMAWTVNNCDTYWRLLLQRARRVDPWFITAFTSYGTAWVVLGVCRLHYTLSTGRITSKENAGAYGLETFSQRWHRVVEEALRVRRSDQAAPSVTSAISQMATDLGIRRASDGGSLYATPRSRRDDVLAFADMVITDARIHFGNDVDRGQSATVRSAVHQDIRLAE